MTEHDDSGIYYFLGNTVSHILHALPLHRELGGTFVVLSDKARIAVEKYSVPVINIDNKPRRWMRFGHKLKPVHEYATIDKSLRRTTDFLNENAKVVLFYDLFNFDESVRLTRPETVFLTHGNMLKSYMNESNRLEIIKQYDYMAALGPYLKSQFIANGIDPSKLIDLGIARTDDLMTAADDITVRADITRELGVDPERKIVSYMPTFWGASSIHNTGKEIVRNCPDDFTLLFRPHPQTPVKILKQYTSIIKNKKNVRLIDSLNGTPIVHLLAVSDVIILDRSSIALEALLLDKPLVFAYDTNTPRALSTYKPIQEIVNYSKKIVLNETTELKAILNEAILNGIDNDVWQAARQDVWYQPCGGATQSIETFLCSLVQSYSYIDTLSETTN